MRLCGRRKIRRATYQPGQSGRNGIERLARGVARSETFGIGWKLRKPRIPLQGKLTSLHPLYLVREFGELVPIGGEEAIPNVVQASPACADAGIEMFANPRG